MSFLLPFGTPSDNKVIKQGGAPFNKSLSSSFVGIILEWIKSFSVKDILSYTLKNFSKLNGIALSSKAHLTDLSPP